MTIPNSTIKTYNGPLLKSKTSIVNDLFESRQVLEKSLKEFQNIFDQKMKQAEDKLKKSIGNDRNI